MIALLSAAEADAVCRAANYVIDAWPQPDPASWGDPADHIGAGELSALVRVVRKIGTLERHARLSSALTARDGIEGQMDTLAALAERQIRAAWVALPPGTPDRTGTVARQLGLTSSDVAEVIGSDDARALGFWAETQAAAIRQAWAELPADVRAADRQICLQAVAARLCLTTDQVTAIIFPEGT